MKVSSKVQYISFAGDEIHGVLGSVEDPITTETPNRTDLANGVPPEQARIFRATQQFGDVYAIVGDTVFKARKNLAPILGLDYDANGEALSLGDLIKSVMHSQRLRSGGTDGTELAVEPEALQVNATDGEMATA
jgi:hypothetical protein